MTFIRHLMRSTLVVLAAAAIVAARASGQQNTRAQSAALAAADAAWNAGRHDEALGRYQTLLRSDSSALHVMYRVAVLLARSKDVDGSIALFRKYITLAPNDLDGRMGLARALAWGGRYEAAVSVCDSLLARDPRNRDAAFLAAQALAWGGNVRSAVNRYERWLVDHPADGEAWLGVAQVWKWSGRGDREREALRHAVTADPGNTSARAQLQVVETALAPSLEPLAGGTNDSDKNRTTTYGFRAGLTAPWSSRLLAEANYRMANLDAWRGTAATLRGSSAWAPLGDHLSLRGAVGAERLEASTSPTFPGVTRIAPLLAASLSSRLTSRLSLGGGVSRTMLDETVPAIFAGVAATEVEAEGTATAPSRLALTVGGGRSWLAGGSGPNTRYAVTSVLRWAVAPSFSVATTLRTFGYGHAASDGYFAPRRYVLGEASARWESGGDLGWAFASEIGLGRQAITGFDDTTSGRLAQRYNASLAYRPALGVEWGVSGSLANAASPTTIDAANYRIVSVAVRGRLRL